MLRDGKCVVACVGLDTSGRTIIVDLGDGIVQVDKKSRGGST